MNYKFDTTEHLHLLDGKPLTGTSSVGNVLAKNLTWWAAELSAIECLETGEKIETIREEYLSACNSGDKKKGIDALQKKYPIFKKARFAHFDKKNKTAEEGTDLHAELEDYVKTMMRLKPGREWDSKIKPFMLWASENIDEFLASEAHCYESNLFVGGITDCVARLKDGSLAVIDFKSSKEVYKNHAIQAGGYAIQIDANGLFSEDGEHNKKLDGPIDVLVIVPFGADKIVPKVFRDIETYKQAFRSAVVLYRLMFNHEDY